MEKGLVVLEACRFCFFKLFLVDVTCSQAQILATVLLVGPQYGEASPTPHVVNEEERTHFVSGRAQPCPSATVCHHERDLAWGMSLAVLGNSDRIQVFVLYTIVGIA